VEYKNLVRDFAERTLKNLESIEAVVRHDPHAEVFEVTQLINSMLGLLVFPQQRFFESIPETSLVELRSNGWPIPAMKGSPPYAENLRDLMRCLRNGISHCNLEFTSDGHQLSGLRIWLVVQENEGLITEAFGQQKAAVARAKQLSRSCPSMRTEIAKYLIVLNSTRQFGATPATE